MSTDEYVPSDEQVRGRYCDGTYVQTGHTTAGEDFDAWLARARRDAAREALDGLAEHSDSRDGDGVKGRLGRIIRIWRDARYPEETP